MCVLAQCLCLYLHSLSKQRNLYVLAYTTGVNVHACLFLCVIGWDPLKREWEAVLARGVQCVYICVCVCRCYEENAISLHTWDKHNGW